MVCEESADLEYDSCLIYLNQLIDKQAYGEDHPGYAKTLYNLAALLQDMEKYTQAEELFERVSEIRKNILAII